MIYKVCNKCQENKELSIDYFRQCKYLSGKLYFKSYCRICETNAALQYNKTYKKSDLQKQKFKQYKKQWKLKNKESQNCKYRNRFLNDIPFKLRKNVSRTISRALKKENGIKLASIKKYLQYSISELKKHLEFQFDDNMKWENYGNYWHIDHIIPQSLLPYSSMEEENFKKCWSLNNLRPLEAKQNMLDGSTRIRHKMYITNNGVSK